jgi:hypothetical protein
MLLTVDLYKNFIDVESVSVTMVLSFQATGIYGTEFYTPQADRLAANYDAPFSE